jgi:RNA polymerase sigma factor (sigma-70 family)
MREPDSPLRTIQTMGQAMLDSDVILGSISEPARFALIFDRHFGAIHSYARRRVGKSTAEEIASQTFLVAFDRRATYDASRAGARPWLFGIATNLIHEKRRQEERQFRAYARAVDVSQADHLEGAENRADAVRLRPQLAASLVALPKEEADPLLLFALAELSYEEVADALELPVGTVKSRLHRARGRIREQLRLPRTSREETPIANSEVDHG